MRRRFHAITETGSDLFKDQGLGIPSKEQPKKAKEILGRLYEKTGPMLMISMGCRTFQALLTPLVRMAPA